MRGTSLGAVVAALFAGAANAAGVTITVSNDLEAARPAAVIAVPFRDIAAIAPELRMYHVIVRDPRTGLPFEGNVIPADRISPQAAALLSYYPLPNASATAGANYQTPLLAAVQQDSLQVNVSKTLRPGTALAGSFSFQRSETDSVSLFNFADTSAATSINGSLNFSRRLTTRLTTNSQSLRRFI